MVVAKQVQRDLGTHTVCAVMTQEFLEYTKSKGNNLSTPIPAYQFPGLKPGDRWCLCYEMARGLPSWQRSSGHT